MSVGLFSFDICITLILSGYLLYTYGNWMRHRVAVTLAVLVAWYFSFIIIFVLPLDVSNTAYKQCMDSLHSNQNKSSTITSLTGENVSTIQPQEKIVEVCHAPSRLIDDSVLLNLWRIVYWSSQLLTWLILPMMQSFTQAGEFTIYGKIRSSLLDNSIYYASYFFIALIIVIYIAFQPDLHLNLDRIKAIVAAASNTWGLFVLVLMLGYGLVEIPRSCWRNAQRGYQLNRAYFKIAKLMTEKTDAEETAEDAVSAAYAASQVISQVDPRRDKMDTILQKIPLEMLERIKRRQPEYPFGDDSPSEKLLVRLHRNVIKGLQNLNRTEAQWFDQVDYILELEDINRNMISNEHVFKRTSSKAPTGIFHKTFCSPTIEWYWKCLVNPLLLRIAAVVFAIMSVMIIWSEVTFFCMHPPLSLFAVFINLAKANFSYWAIEMISFLTICYLSLCAYYTIFKIRILNYYYLATNHQSDEYTLLFSGALLCRLTPPLCLNFLSLIHMDSHVIQSQILETSYTQVMGHMDVISIISDYFNIYFPIILLVLTLATYFSFGARCLSVIGFQQFLDQESEVTLEMIDEGKEHIKREKRRIQRLTNAEARRGYTSTQLRSETPRQSSIYRDSNNTNSPYLSSPQRSLLGSHQAQSILDEVSDSHNIEMEPTAPQQQRFEPQRNLFDDI